MPTIWGIRDGYALRPYRKFATALEDIPEGARLRIKIDKDRNGKFSALFHVMLGLIADAVNSGPATTSIEALKKWVKIKKGHYDVVKLPTPLADGTTHAVDYHSTSFNKMGEDEFHEFCRDACELIRAELAPWIAESPKWKEAMDILNSILPEAA
ncbi:DUF1367 family protein [Pseudosulfitobacter pseudonitzschiae]|uniref:DUF1367 family protein n=1 Tax=Pseudosulfitobacter pseudonitzschiae TaxID=1402135 RepID=UPI001AF53EEB|nr:DUF1367 family protein [Pseudosulfitobacter pseudonitzschiae]MBM1817192.1 DUF1367 family protein [Pseudosulfitobacter pseudonitzschiae]MBM1834203.1 DUF1367 family protein [Pseudosulfitobacter pseudonitzschiae]MBM1839068.1 DUF1367 family protein [Pseudosulfitobacter pseudonitzschiae]MBM1843916.1 DUF1367 family protein [Pseudosulfitobacter pseudonitzschiae]MBM1848753.1 DUF1367 family protein [Pseudosulfitobacter pseudonitzschiae]